MSVSLEGQIKGISLTSFLQIVQMEKLTCTLAVSYNKKKGNIFIKNGDIIDSDTNTGLKALDAAFDILGWDDPSIELKKNMPAKERHINMPLMNLLMEALRIQDEKKSNGEAEEEDIILEVVDEEVLEPLEEKQKETEEANLDDFSLDNEIESDLDSVSLIDESGDISNSLDGIKLEMESSGEKEIEEQEIPDELLIDDVNPDLDIQKKEERTDTVDQFDLSSAESPNKLNDFTETIVLPDLDEKISFEGEENTPRVEDFIEKKEKSKSKIAAIVLAVLILSGAAAGAGIYYINQKNISAAYNKLKKNMASMEFEEQKVTLLKKFIINYPDTKYGKLAEKELAAIQNRSQRKEYLILTEKIKDIKINENYPKRVTIYYDNFLQKFPDGIYAKKIKSKKASIPNIMREYLFDQVKKISYFDTFSKIEAIKKYRKKYPGIHSEELDIMMEKSGKAYIAVIKDEISKCDDLKKYDEAIKKINRFNSIFLNQKQRLMVEKLRKKLNEEYLASALLNTAEKNTSSLIEEKKFLENYIKSHNIYSLVIVVKERIRAIDETLKSEKNFNDMMKYADNDNIGISQRINRLNAYIYMNIPEKYKKEASKKLTLLKYRLQEMRAAKKAKEIPKKEIKKDKKEEIFDLKAAYKASIKLKGLMDKSRFLPMDNFSFVDTFTGKTWMIVDSNHIFKKECFHFKEAKNEIQRIDLDGHNDWRLPTEAELLTLFKNKPFFPSEKNKWYWSSDVFEKGFNTYSAVVTNDQTQTRKKEFKDIFSDCGNFKLIRP